MPWRLICRRRVTAAAAGCRKVIKIARQIAVLIRTDADRQFLSSTVEKAQRGFFLFYAERANREARAMPTASRLGQLTQRASHLQTSNPARMRESAI